MKFLLSSRSILRAKLNARVLSDSNQNLKAARRSGFRKSELVYDISETNDLIILSGFLCVTTKRASGYTTLTIFPISVIFTIKKSKELTYFLSKGERSVASLEAMACFEFWFETELFANTSS